MPEKKRWHAGRLPIIGDMLCSTLVFPFSLTFVEKMLAVGDKKELTALACVVYGLMALAHVFRALRLRERSQLDFIAHMIYGIAFAVCVVLEAALGYTDLTCTVLELTFWGCLVLERVRSLVFRHKPWQIVLNVLAMLLILLLATISMSAIPMVFMMIAASAYAFVSIMIVTFSQIRLDILADIVRKTYAGEIISGLALLMAAFSYLLELFDEAFETFWDGLWYCFAVVTTIGFGDITPTSAVGRICTVILGVYGIIVVALITSIIVNFYGEMKKTDAAGEK